MLERIINKLEADGVKFKYETDAEWKKAGLSDPYEDQLIKSKLYQLFK